MHKRLTGLWRHPDFMKLWTGQSVSVLGSIIGGTAMSFTAILFLEATPFQIGVIAAANLLPGFLAGLIAGVWIDRLRRRPIMIAADLGRALLFASVALAAFFGVLRIEQLYLVTLLTSLLTLCFDVAYQSYLPALVRREDLVEGNSKLSASASVAEAGGFGVAGWLVQLFTAPMAIFIDAISFVFSAGFIALIHTPEPPPRPAHEHESMVREIKAGLREVLHNPLLRTLAGCTLLLDFFGSIYGTVVVLYMSRGLGFDTGILGMIWAIGGVSSFLGAVYAPRLNRRLGVGPAMVAGLTVSALSMFLIPAAQGATLLSAILLILPQLTGDGAHTVYSINETSLRQAIAPERMLGRVTASIQFVGQGAMLTGALVGGLVGEAIGVRQTLALAALGTLLTALALGRSPLRRVQETPTAPVEPLAAGT